MSSNWTDLDPGAGDPAVCATAKQWIDAQLVDLADSETTVSTILRDLDDSWTGESATAFRSRLEEFRTRLEDSTQAMETAGKAIIIYGDAVTDIARQAEPLKSALATAQAALNGILNHTPSALSPSDRFEAEQDSLDKASEAATALKKLAGLRAEVDRKLATTLATAASIAWEELDCTVDPITGTPRDAANEQVMDLFEHFRSGDERGAVLTDDDIFVRNLMRSAHIASVRERVLTDLRSGDLSQQKPLDYSRSISDNPFVLVDDIGNILTLPMTGTIPDLLLGGQSMPETFLGSYQLEVRAGEPRSDGGVEVTYVINNDTSIDSATRIPGTGGAHFPGPYEAMSAANVRDGEWATHHQTIVWTETVYP